MKKLLSFKKILWIVAVAVVAGAGYVIWGSSGASAPAQFRKTAVEKRDIVTTIDATGTVEPEDLVDVGARVSGEIVSFGTDMDGKTIDYGSRVREGDVLAVIDKEIPESDLLKAKAALAKANASRVLSQARLNKAERDWKRAERIGVSGALSQAAYDGYLSEWESAKAELDVAAAGIVQAEAELRSAERNMEYCTIKAPVTGVVINRVVSLGQTVVSNMNASSLFLLAKDLKKMEVWASVNEADIGSIFPGQAVTFTVDAFPGETFNGTVGKIRLNATMTQNVVTYIVEIVTDNSSGRLLPYLTANLKFEVKRADGALSVPAGALRYTPEAALIAPGADEKALGARSKVWVDAGNGLVRPVPVKAGLSDGEWTQVLKGDLAVGQEVVTGQVQVTAAGGKSASSNPFTPTPPRRNRGGSSQGQGAGGPPANR